MHALLKAGAVLAIAIAPPLTAQQVTPVRPSTYAITGARIVPVSGPTIERGTIVVRNGIIAAVGANVAVPADARVVDGSGLSVYPGLIDAYGTLGLRAAPAGGGGGGGGGGGFGGGAAPQAPAGSPNSRFPVGLRPEVRAIDQLVDDADFSSAYGAGITTALTAPAGRTYEGQSALINLIGNDFGQMAVRPTVALHVGFQGIGGGRFPGSLLGVMAALRQSFLDAQNYGALKAAHERSPRGTARPPYDPSLEALQPVLAGTVPVVFRASTQREIERSLGLAKEFNLKAIIAGGTEAYLVADQLKAANVPVLLSLNFPRVTTAPAADADPEPIRILQGRVQAPKTPGQLAQAGVRFAFQSGGGNHSDFLANVRRAVAGGLSTDAALRALTLGSAEILGAADRIGSIETGKVANLTLVRGDIFASDARVTSVFVDGREFQIRGATGGAGGANGPPARPAAELEGTWAVSVALDNRNFYTTIQLRTENDLIRGTMQGDFGVAEISNVHFEDDDRVSISASVTLPEGTEEAWFHGLLRDGVLTGRIEIVGHAPGLFGAYRTTESLDRAQSRQER